MGEMVSQITSLTIAYSTVYSGTDQRKHQSSASLAFVRGIHRGPVNSPHKWPITGKMFPFDDVIMSWRLSPTLRLTCPWVPVILSVLVNIYVGLAPIQPIKWNKVAFTAITQRPDTRTWERTPNIRVGYHELQFHDRLCICIMFHKNGQNEKPFYMTMTFIGSVEPESTRSNGFMGC